MSVIIPLSGFCQNVAPNSSFEVGTNQPVNWELTGGSGQLQPFGHSGSNCINITSDGSVMSRWRTYNTPAAFGQVYALRYWTSSSNAAGAGCFGGFNTVYSDFAIPGGTWTNYSMVAWIPSVSGQYLNLGQVVVNGSVYFDDVEMYRVTPVHKSAGGFTLGAGEKLAAGRYTYQSSYGAHGGSYARILLDANTSFASFRWYMNPGSALIYRHELGGMLMTNVTVKGTIWNYNNITSTALQVEASTNGTSWVLAGSMTGGATQLTATVPAGLLPAPALFIRLKSTNAAQFSLTEYVFTADVPTNLVADGVTYFVEQRQALSVVTPLSVADTTNGQVMTVSVANPGAAQTFGFYSAAQLGGATNSWSLSTNVPAGATNSFDIFLPSAGAGDNLVSIAVTNGSGSNVYQTSFQMSMAPTVAPENATANLAPNPSFETGTNSPAAWAVSSGTGNWGGFGRTGSHSVSLTSDGTTLNRWFTYGCPVEAGKLYSVRFWTSCSNSFSGGCIGGFNTVYSDFPLPGSAWTNYSMVAWIPSVAGLYFNLAQVSVNGTINFDDVEVYPVVPVHKLVAGRTLGGGEKLETGRYTFQSGYGGYGGSYARCLQDSSTSFAGFRWYMNSGSSLVYHHELGGMLITNATLKGGIWNYNGISSASLQFEASTNGVDWLPAGAMTGGATSLTTTVPSSLLPATDVFVRLRSTNAAQFSLTNYVFIADVPSNVTAADGVTYFFEQRQSEPILVPLGISDTSTGQVLTVTLSNPGGLAETYSIHSQAELGGYVVGWNLSTNLAAGQSNTLSIFLPSAGVGDNNLTLSVTNSLGSNVFNTSFVVKGAQVTPANTGAFGNLAPNPSFEIGTNGPTAWFGWSQWQNFGRTGSRCTSITGDGNGTPRVYTVSCPIESGTTYSVHYWTMASNAVSGSCFGGFNSNYRDFGRPPGYWVKNSMIAYMPDVSGSYLNIGLVVINGTIYFDDVEVYRTIPIHKQVGSHLLGAGESITNGQYAFHTASSSAQYSDYAGNYARSLQSANTSFAGFRWYMNPGSYVIHRHELDGMLMTNAVLRGQIWNYNNITNTSLQVEVSTNGSDWQMAGQITGNAGVFPTFNLTAPTNLFPTPVVYVRFKSSNPAQFSFTDYSFIAGMPGLSDIGNGETCFFEQKAANPGFQPMALVDRPTGRVATVALPNATSIAQSFSIQSQTEFNGHRRTWTSSTNVPANQTNIVDVVVPTAGFGENAVSILVTNGLGAKVFDNSFATWVSILADDSYGERLPSPSDTPVWWCGSTYKVGRTRAQPLATNDAVHISAARNEYEPFQLALRPQTPMTNVTVAITDMTLNGGGGTISSTNVTMAMVEYVPVTRLYSAVESSTGDTADPLVPITGPFNAPAYTNTTVWFTIKVPRNVPAGVYLATVTIQHNGGNFTAPVRLRVFDFSLSDTTHRENLNNVVVDELWHKPATTADRMQIWDLYLADMARHRVTPYMAQNYQPVQWAYNSSSNSFTFSFTNFDQAMSRFLDDFNLQSFQVLDENRDEFGIGPVFRYSYDGSGNKIINPAFKPLYPGLIQPVVQHLIEKGWFEKAYSFWIDEPALDNSQAVLNMAKTGFRMIGDAAPGLKRMLPDNTFDFPKSDLFGDVDIWSPGFDPYSFHLDRNQERQAAGDKIWPYCFIRPFSPWPNNFIDQPAASPRIRQWIGEKLGWDGELYWGINYYFTFPQTGTRNPWITPFVTTGDFSNGNGDGSLVYPPLKEYPTNTVIAGTIDSVRWENLREGIEDREYFWVLKTLIAEAESRLGSNHPSVLAARAAETNALAFVPWPPAYPYEPEDMHASRDAIALAIESLDDGHPFFASQPVSKAIQTGNTEYLQGEVLGWPMPAIQWQHAGTNLPGATSPRLHINSVTPDMAGTYRMIATNISGSVTSSVANFTIYDATMPPQIIRQPASLSRTNGGRAVLGVFASSVTPLTYQWFLNGVPIAGATNLTLVLTNLNLALAGNYTVTVSNSVGAVTSTAAQIYLPVPPTLHAQPTAGGIEINISSLYATGQIQFSTNLTDWQTLASQPPSTTPITFVDPGVTNSPYRYYRVLIAP